MNPHHTIGDWTLRAWQTGPGVVWVQTTDPKHARRLSQRRDSRLVGEGVAGGYLRIFSFRHRMAWAKRLIDRYTRNEKATNARVPGQKGRQAPAGWPSKGKSPSNSIEDVKGVTQ